jgi:FtsZ-interacting cell division protein ZipA
MTRTDARSGPALRVGLCSRTRGYFRAMSNITLIIVIVVAVAIIVALVVAGYQMARRKQTERLRQQYGPEYDRAIDEADSQRAAESELRDRAKRHDELELRTLDSSERADFERRWTDVQAQFVDDPSTAVRNAEGLVVDVMAARGYPADEDFDRRADDLSVEHAEVVQRYREARRIAQANEDGGVDTEDLRQAVTSYRALVQALLAGDGDATEADDVGEDHDGTQYKRDMSARGQDNDHMTERETRA